MKSSFLRHPLRPMVVFISLGIAGCGSVSRVVVLRHPETNQSAECRVDPWGDVDRTRQISHCVAAYVRAGYRVLGDSESTRAVAPQIASKSGVDFGRESIERLRARDWEATVRQAGAAIASGELNQDRLAAMFLVRAYAYWNLGQREIAKRELQLAFDVRPGNAAARQLRDEFIKKERAEMRRPRVPGRSIPDADDIAPPITQF